MGLGVRGCGLLGTEMIGNVLNVQVTCVFVLKVMFIGGISSKHWCNLACLRMARISEPAFATNQQI